MGFDPDIHHRRSVRLRDYDYSGAGAYFVTICVANRECLFGETADGVMRMNDAGLAVAECWQAVPDHFPQVELDEFVVMPNHLHGIIVIDRRDTACRAQVEESFSRPISGSLPTIIRSFKSAATKRINQFRDNPGAPMWQRNYYERVIRDEQELDGIRQYITGNPAQWVEDKNHPARQSSAS
jgi:REP element-mobilizing transposase RayT